MRAEEHLALYEVEGSPSVRAICAQFSAAGAAVWDPPAEDLFDERERSFGLQLFRLQARRLQFR